MRMLRGWSLLPLLATLAIAPGCDDKKNAPTEATPSPGGATAAPSAAPKRAETAAPASDKLPSIVVDSPGVSIAGDTATATTPEGAKKVRDLVAKLKVEGKSVPVVALRGARTPDVAVTVDALGAGGATEVVLRTQDRSRKDATLKVTPEKKAGKLADCTVVAMVLKDRTTASWTLKGGVALKYSKGMAGPDLSMTFDGVTKQVNACASTAFAFSGDDSVEWGLTFDLVTKIATAEPPLKPTTWVLLREAPVAGRPVKVGD